MPGMVLALLAAPLAMSANSPAIILATIAADLDVSVRAATWLVMMFGWALAVGTPLMAGLLRHRGIHATLMLSTALVTAGTSLAAIAPSLTVLLPGRAAQAIGGAGLVTVAMSLANGSARRMGMITAGFGMFGATGPLLGSMVTDATSWRAAFVLQTMTLLAVPIVAKRAARHPTSNDRPFDARGSLLLVAFVTATVFTPHFPLPAIAGAVLAAGLLAAHLRARPLGFIPAALLRTRAFLLASGLALALGTSYFLLLYAVPRLLTQHQGWTATRIGTGQLMALLVGSATSWGLTVVSSRLHRAALLATLIGFGALAPITAAITPWAPLLLAACAVAALAAAAGQATLAVIATNAAPTPQKPTAIGLFNLCYQLGGAFGPTLAAILIS
ncbi:MFS transporter [Micromonospora sp. NPDC047707]|uniref:MFS transporter n=1 Tax=Micromonospora sp. NPDC047707 TaxID=3154498 RepID=UPI0034571ACD